MKSKSFVKNRGVRIGGKYSNYIKVWRQANGQFMCTIPRKIAEMTHMQKGSVIHFTRIEMNKIKIDVFNDDHPMEESEQTFSSDESATSLQTRQSHQQSHP